MKFDQVINSLNLDRLILWQTFSLLIFEALKVDWVSNYWLQTMYCTSKLFVWNFVFFRTLWLAQRGQDKSGAVGLKLKEMYFLIREKMAKNKSFLFFLKKCSMQLFWKKNEKMFTKAASDLRSSSSQFLIRSLGHVNAAS